MSDESEHGRLSLEPAKREKKRSHGRHLAQERSGGSGSSIPPMHLRTAIVSRNKNQNRYKRGFGKEAKRRSPLITLIQELPLQ